MTRFLTGRDGGRLLLALLPTLLWMDGVAAQFAPVINAGDQQGLSQFQSNPPACGPSATASMPAANYWNMGMAAPVAMDSCFPGGGASCGECECGQPGCEVCLASCCKPLRCKPHGIDLFGEFLYLRPRNVEVAYAVPIDGPIAPVMGNGIQIGPTGVVDPNHQGAYRVGFNVIGKNCSGLTAQWTRYENSSEDSIATGIPNVIRSMVTHPLGTNAASDGLQASAQLDIDFNLIDLILRTPITRGCRWHADVMYGIRYGQLTQEFASSIDVNGQTDVITEIDFNGLGPQIGVNSIRQLGCGGFHVYSRGDASFMVGKFQADYLQQDAFAGEVVNSSWESGRIVPLLEMELGVGYATRGGMFHLRGGYLVNAWFNSVRTDEYINAVQTNNPDGLGTGISFDGLVVRGEFRF